MQLPRFTLLLYQFALSSLLLLYPLFSHAGSETKKWDVNQPPGPSQTVSIDTRSGTWMSVDVSPDGKQLVFDLLGDLYLLPITGGEALPLTHSIAWEMQPRFSPDGKQIAYISDAAGGDNLWVMNTDGSNAHSVSNEKLRLLNNPVWHPNGQYLAARKHFAGTRSLGSGEIWLYHLGAGGSGVALNEKPNWQKDLGEPAFSKDGRYLYYSQDTTPGTTFQYNKDSHKQIYQILRRDLQEGKTRAFVSGPGGAVRPTPSPDGKYLAFVRRLGNQTTLFLKDLRTGMEKPVWPELERDMQEAWAVHGVYPAFAWLPDSKEIVVWAKGGLWRVNPFAKPSEQAVEIPFHVKHTREVRPALRFAQNVAPDSFDVRQLSAVNVSPQGDKVVYSALGHVYLRSLKNGAQAKRITTQETHFEYAPRFSRDGKQIVFTTWNDESTGSVRVLEMNDKDGKFGKERIITKEYGKYLTPVFSPDGKQIAYTKKRGGNLTTPWYGLETGVYLTPSDGSGTPVRITEEGHSPQFGPDSKNLYVTRNQTTGEVDFHSELVRINLDNRQEQVIAKSEFATLYALSPDATHLAYNERFHVFVSPLPLAGKTLTLGKGNDGLPVKQFDVNAGDYLHWSGDGKTIHYTLGDELFSHPVQSSFAYVATAPKKPGDDSAQAPLETPGIKIGFRANAASTKGLTVISGARIVTMKGDEVIEDGRIVIQNNRILAIGRAKEIPVPPNAWEFDAKGKTIIPGLVDVHWHGGMGEDNIIPQQSWINYASLAFGVTTLHDPSNLTAQIFTHSEMQRAGLVIGPRIFSTGTILYGAKGNFAAPVDSLPDALTHLKRMKAAGAFSVKSYNQPRRDQRQQIVEAARQTEMMVVPEGGSLFQHNMTMIIDGHTGIEHALPVAKVYDDVTQLWSQTAVGYTPTLGVGYGGLDGEHYWYAHTNVWQHPLLTRYVPRSILEPASIRRPIAPEEEYNVFDIAKSATKLQRTGVNVNIGAHGQREGLAAHWELWTLFKGGMTPLEAIRAGTLNGAKYLGMEGDIGSLEAGKLADLVIIDGDLLSNFLQSDRVTHVMQNGRLYESASMNEIGRTPKARKPFFFEGQNNTGMQVDTDAEGNGDGHGH
jgi:imidazolonepropionase-like amidohydrolase/Tol biopolymer transport system component